MPECSQAAFHTPRSSPFEKSRAGESCPDRTQVGVIEVHSSQGGGETRSFGVFNLEPPPGVPSELGAAPYGAPIVFTPQVRQAEGEYGLTLQTRNFPQLFDTYGFELSIWGTPWSVAHNTQRGNCLNEAEPSFGWSKCSAGQPKQNPPLAYLTMPTSCEGPLVFLARASSWQQPGAVSRTAQGSTLTGCESLGFNPVPFGRISDPRASSPSGYEFEITQDTGGITDPHRLAPSAVRKAVVRLPEGVSDQPLGGSGTGCLLPSSIPSRDADLPSRRRLPQRIEDRRLHRQEPAL